MTIENVIFSFNRGREAFSFTGMMVLPLTKTVFNYLPAATKAPRWVRRLIFQAALKRAYTSFAAYYPQWTASLFDEHFLCHGATALLAGYEREGKLLQANKLALAWDQQLGLASAAIREQRLAELTPIAADFLDWLTLELAISPFF